MAPLADAAARIIRERSARGGLTGERELRDELVARGFLGAEAGAGTPPLADILDAASAQHADLREAPPVPDVGRRFFSLESMTEAYADLLVKKEGDPLELMAAIVRQNSALYPRPFPLGAFEQLPFGLPRDEILACLERMRTLPAYEDIARTCTSANHVYLYSRRSLEPDYAASLAEWYDVGQAASP
jgi:hypothetical protein